MPKDSGALLQRAIRQSLKEEFGRATSQIRLYVGGGGVKNRITNFYKWLIANRLHFKRSDFRRLYKRILSVSDTLNVIFGSFGNSAREPTFPHREEASSATRE